MGNYFDISKNILETAKVMEVNGFPVDHKAINEFTFKLLSYDPSEGTNTKGSKIEGLLGVLLDAESQRDEILKEDPDGMNKIYREAVDYLHELGGVTGYLNPEKAKPSRIEGSSKKN